MRENGWVCETYEEFRTHCPMPKLLEGGTTEQVEGWFEHEWKSRQNEIVHYGDSAFPFMDIRYLEVHACLSNLGYPSGFTAGMIGSEYDRNRISQIPDSVFEKMQELDEYYDDRYLDKLTLD